MIRTPMNREQRLQRGENQRIYSQMRRFFAPASIVPAPLSDPQATGNRNTTVTARNSANSQATDSAQLRMQAGSVTWYYNTRFKSPPNVTATPVADLGGTFPTLRLKGPGTSIACVILSSDGSDNRLVNLHAVGTPF